MKEASLPAQAAEPTRLVGTAWDEDGNDVAQSVLTGENQKVRALCLTTPEVVVPILFVPGIMGTRLRVSKRDQGPAWLPPENTWETITLGLTHLVRTAADRQRLLNPETTEVDDGGPAFPDDTSKTLLSLAPGQTDAERIKWRGWGQLHADSYLGILSLLETSMAMIFDPDSQGTRLDGTRYLFKKEAGMSKPSAGTMSRQDHAVERMRKILSNLRKRSTHDIPTEPGYCFEGGFIANPEWEMEEAGIDIDVAGHPDAFVSVWFYPLSRRAHSEPLLDRVGGVLQMLGRMATSVHVLRRGDRQVGPYKGQEFLVTAPNSGGLRGHSFIWETEGDGTLDTPALKIELTTGYRDKKGNPQQTRLTDEQAIKLWDDVLNSFRLRPVLDPQGSRP
nr:T6SS immunity protein Tli4 family protein [Herbaspirillum sp. B39]